MVATGKATFIFPFQFVWISPFSIQARILLDHGRSQEVFWIRVQQGCLRFEPHVLGSFELLVLQVQGTKECSSCLLLSSIQSTQVQGPSEVDTARWVSLSGSLSQPEFQRLGGEYVSVVARAWCPQLESFIHHRWGRMKPELQSKLPVLHPRDGSLWEGHRYSPK